MLLDVGLLWDPRAERVLTFELPLYGPRSVGGVLSTETPPPEEETFISTNTPTSLYTPLHRGTSVVRNHPPLGPYRRPIPRDLRGSLGGWALSHRPGNPVAMPPLDSREHK